ncbi:MAG: CoA transferase [Polaromonas sp.]|uniref:CaiB/BaiF CoA transferase family protein n=1 Tax=Polaromonas sp. TaxID=1869339 RepID=UPI00248834A6|nr:CoA transferase [Polaromonas sp.]MDI1239717.1 CoA transferase [Polaromonas sp.]
MTSGATARLALEGVRIFDASQGVAGPYCGLLLAMNGAEVIKIEPPEGDWLRQLGDRVGDHSPHSWYLNRGKTSRVFDFKNPGQRREAIDLAAGCDVFLASFRPGVVERLGLSYADLQARHPALVHCLISGYGQSGPRASRAAVDGVLQAFCGWADVNRTGGQPRVFPYFAVDMLAGMYAYQAVLQGLIRRWRFGEGARLEVSLMEAAAAFMGPRMLEIALAHGVPPELFSPPNGVFQTRDGWFLVAVTSQPQFALACQALGCDGLAQDPRFASRALRGRNGEALTELFAQRFTQLESADCERRFEAQGAMGSTVLSPWQLLQDEQMAAAEAVLATETPEGDLAVVSIPGASRDLQRQPAPALGLHTQLDI